jgi:hypothetical protein
MARGYGSESQFFSQTTWSECATLNAADDDAADECFVFKENDRSVFENVPVSGEIRFRVARTPTSTDPEPNN